ncbi:hypothetical protein [Sinorhizobium fredii]
MSLSAVECRSQAVAFSLPFLAKVEVSYQVQFDGKADNDNKPK